MNGSHPKMRALIVAAAFAAAAGCGGKQGSGVKPLARASAGDRVRVEGTLSLRGSTPYPILLLESEREGTVMVQSRTLQDELESLSGMTVVVEGPLLPAIDGETPLVDADTYTILALPTGEVPIVGSLTLVGEECVLDARGGKRLWLRGDFTDIFRGFAGARLWVVGREGDAALPGKPENTVPYWVTGYGILSPR